MVDAAYHEAGIAEARRPSVINDVLGEIMFEKANYNRLVALEEDAQALKNEFAHLRNIKEFFAQRRPPRLLSVHVETIDDYTVDVSYLNTTVRFHLLLTYAKGRSHGRVVCMRKCTVFGDTQYDKVGEFGFTRHGDTDLKINQDETFCMSINPDFIVMIFLDRAFETGPAQLEQAI